MQVVFGDCALDTGRFELRRAGAVVEVEPQVFDVLVYLIERHDRVVERRELLDALWPGRAISESTLNTSIKAARQAIGDDGQTQKLIATARGRGYRFVGTVDHCPPAAEAQHRSAARRRDKASVAVMPFDHTNGSDEIAWTAAVLAQDIGTNLARIPGFVVISRNSTAYYAGRPTPSSAIGRELGADYLVEGAVWSTDRTVRVSVQLLEAVSGHVLWADRTAVPSGAACDFQDEAVREIVARLEPELNRAELSLLRQRRPADMSAWALYRRASALLSLKGWSEATFAEAGDLLRLAIARDPALAFAHAYHALLLAIGHLVGLVNEQRWHEESTAAAENALALDNQDSDVLGYAGCAYADMGQLGRGRELMHRAIELNPSNAQAHAGLGATMLRQGEDDGVEIMRYGMSLSPRDSRLGIWGALLARELLSLGRVDEAIDAAEHASRCDSKNFLPPLILALARSAARNPGGARSAVQNARRIRPALSEADIARFATPDELAKLRQVESDATACDGD